MKLISALRRVSVDAMMTTRSRFFSRSSGNAVMPSAAQVAAARRTSGAQALPVATLSLPALLALLVRERPDVVGLTADLAKYTDMHIFAKAFPETVFTS